MKSSFAYSMLYNDAEVGDKKGLYITRTCGIEFEAADGNAGDGRSQILSARPLKAGEL